MSTHYEVRYTTNPEDFKSYDTERIRRDFLIKGLLQKDQIQMVYTNYDRYIAGGAGISNYTFISRMAGDNLDYGDMDGFTPLEMQ